jgi:hypothetical protein
MYRIQECTRVRTGVSSAGVVAVAVAARNGFFGDSSDDNDGPITSAVSAVSGMTKIELLFELKLEMVEERTPFTRRFTFSM